MQVTLSKWKKLHISSFVFGFTWYCRSADHEASSFPLGTIEFAPHRQEVPAELSLFSSYAARTCYTMLHYHMAMGRLMTLNPCRNDAEWHYAGDLLRRFYNV